MKIIRDPKHISRHRRAEKLSAWQKRRAHNAKFVEALVARVERTLQEELPSGISDILLDTFNNEK